MGPECDVAVPLLLRVERTLIHSEVVRETTWGPQFATCGMLHHVFLTRSCSGEKDSVQSTSRPSGMGKRKLHSRRRFLVKKPSPPGEEARGWGLSTARKVGTLNLFGLPLDQVLANKETYFPDGALQLRVDIWFLKFASTSGCMLPIVTCAT